MRKRNSYSMCAFHSTTLIVFILISMKPHKSKAVKRFSIGDGIKVLLRAKKLGRDYVHLHTTALTVLTHFDETAQI